MRLNIVLSVLGMLILMVGAAQIVPLVLSSIFDWGDFYPFFFSCLVAFCGGGLLRAVARDLLRTPAAFELRPREGLAIVGLGWIVVSLFGALPFIFAGTFLTPDQRENASLLDMFFRGITDSYFETVSGFTTTGSSVLVDYDQPRGIMFWRCMTQWLGGMGIIVFSIAILPLLGTGGMQLFKAEVTGPVKDRLTPRIADTAKILWTVYLSLSVLQVLMLCLVGTMPVYESVCHTFATMATGGFSTYQTSLQQTPSRVQYIVAFFMLLAGMSFSLHYRALRTASVPKALSSYFRDEECRFYLTLAAGATVILMIGQCLLGGWQSLEQVFRESVFQVISIVTTTGFVTADYAQWHPVAHIVLFWLMFCGGCAGSTGGGAKMIRVLISAKACLRELRRLARPGTVVVVHVGGKTASDQVIAGVLVFLLLYAMTFLISTVLLSLGGADFTTCLSACATTLTNVGPGLGQVGPTVDFSHFALWQKWLLALNMLLGRLEFYAILILLLPRFWKR